jgi:serine/threonine-protein kinase
VDVPGAAEPEPQIEGHYLQRGLIVDCYKLVERLGSGFSAEVWSADVLTPPSGLDLQQGQKVAIKFYTANALAMPHQVIRIEREYRVAQRLRHPHLIRIYEFMLASPRPNHSFLVMDIAPGPALSAAIKQRKLEAPESLKMLAQILSAADALHEAGALHRDIKPGNVSLSTNPDGAPHCVLLDLGIVSPLFEKSVTAVSRFVGSKHWAPLEQLIGGDLDQRSDLYSIGAVAYNLLVGIEPFTGSPTEAAVAVEMSRNGLKIPELANLPSEIVQLFNACLSNSPKDRPRSARECLSVLRRHGITP